MYNTILLVYITLSFYLISLQRKFLIVKNSGDSYQHLGRKMGELPDPKKRTVAIVRKWGERICVMGSDASVS